MLAQKRLKDLLYYDSGTGKFKWKLSGTGRRKNLDAGTKKPDGYVAIAVDKNIYLAQRLAWLYEYGYFPENDIDHINRDKADNRIKNLREVSRQCNARNCGNIKSNTSGIKGVYWFKRLKKWEVRITIDQKNIFLGLFSDYSDAVCARLAGEQCVGWSGCDSSSPAYKYVYENIRKKAA